MNDDISIGRNGVSIYRGLLKMIAAFPSGDEPGKLYVSCGNREFRLTKQEALVLRDYLDIYLDTPPDMVNLNKDVIKALGDRNGK